METSPRKASCFLSALAGCTDAGLADEIEKYTTHRDRRVRANAVEVISRLQLSDPVKLRILKPKLMDEDNRCRANAAIALAEIDEATALDTLYKMMQDPNKWHRASACYAFGALKPLQAVNYLVRALSDPDTDVRVNATKALRSVGDPKSVQALSGVTADRNVWIRQYAIEALGNMRATVVNARVCALVRQETSVQVLCAALIAIGQTGDGGGAAKAILPFLNHGSEKVRLAAVEAFGYVMTDATLTKLVPCLRDSDFAVRAAAVREIWKAGEFGVVATLHEMLQNYDTDERISAASGLVQIGEVQSSMRTHPNVRRLIGALRRHSLYGKV